MMTPLSVMVEAGSILLLVLAISNAVLVVMGIRRFKTVAHASCGRCGHTVMQLDTDRCAECGVRYVQAGVRAGVVRPGFPTWLIAIIVLLVSGVFILGVRGVVVAFIEGRLPPSVGWYESSLMANLDPTIFPTADGSGRFFLRVYFVEEKLSLEDAYSGYYQWPGVSRSLKVKTLTEAGASGSGEEQLGETLVLKEAVQPEDIRAWLVAAGASDAGEDGAEKLQAQTEKITAQARLFREEGASPSMQGVLQENGKAMTSLGRQVGVAQRKAWISRAIELGVFGAFAIVAAVVLLWSAIRTRRLADRAQA